eukprot:727671_1
MFSGDMLLNPQIFRAPQKKKRLKANYRYKKTHRHDMHHKRANTIDGKVTGASISDLSNRVHKGSFHRANNVPRVNRNAPLITRPESSPLTRNSDDLNIQNVIESTVAMKDNDDQSNKQQRHKMEMNFEDNKHIFMNNQMENGNEPRIPLPGTESKQQLMDMMKRDAYYSNVICNGQMPSKLIIVGLFYLLLIIAIDSYIHMIIVSLIMATICLIVLFTQTTHVVSIDVS